MLLHMKLLVVFNAFLITITAVGKTPLDDIALFYASQLTQPAGAQLQEILTECLRGIISSRLCKVAGVNALMVTTIKGIRHNCDNCNEYQKQVFEQVYSFYTKNRKEDWERIVSRFQFHEGTEYVDQIFASDSLRLRFVNCLRGLEYGGICNTEEMSYVIRATIAGVRNNCMSCTEDQKSVYRKIFNYFSPNKSLWDNILHEFNS